MTQKRCTGILRGHRSHGLLVATAAALLLAGCGGSGNENGGTSGGASTVTTTTGQPTTTVTTTGGKVVQSNGATLRIPVIPKGTTHEYWKSIHAGAVKAAQELNASGHHVEIVWKGPELENDRSSQIDLVRNFITQKVNGMVLAPLDDKALVQPVEQAQSNHIPVVIIDSGLATNDYVSFVATDNEKGGQLAGERLASLLGQKGRVIMLRYQVGSASTDLREKGFLEAIGKYKGITIVNDNQYAGPTVDSAYTQSQNLISRYGGQFDGIFTPNESSTRGMLRALQQANLLGKTRFVGFDSSKDLVDALARKQIQGLVVQNPFKMGYLGLKTLVDSIDGKKVEKRIDTGVTLVTPENMNQADIKTILFPPIDQYLSQGG